MLGKKELGRTERERAENEGGVDALDLNHCTIITPSSRPDSARGAACSRSMDHFSTMVETWGLSTLRIRNPVRFTPE